MFGYFYFFFLKDVEIILLIGVEKEKVLRVVGGIEIIFLFLSRISFFFGYVYILK